MLSYCKHSVAQYGVNDTIVLGSIIVNSDTFGMVYLDDIIVNERAPRRFRRQRRKYNKLQYNIYKVYPYAVIAADVLKDVDSVLLAIGDDKKNRRKYLKDIERELNKKFKGELEDMTISQGHVLVKLIDRETGKSCYEIIKELKGGFSAVVLQSVARIFSHNLKKQYDPTGIDKDMEKIVRELEANRHYKTLIIKQKPKLQAQKDR